MTLLLQVFSEFSNNNVYKFYLCQVSKQHA
jgi:hypothetical protein